MMHDYHCACGHKWQSEQANMNCPECYCYVNLIGLDAALDEWQVHYCSRGEKSSYSMRRAIQAYLACERANHE